MRYDLPAGGRRLVQQAQRLRRDHRPGAVTYREGEATGALPGRLVRARRQRRPRPALPEERQRKEKLVKRPLRRCGGSRRSRMRSVSSLRLACSQSSREMSRPCSGSCVLR